MKKILKYFSYLLIMVLICLQAFFVVRRNFQNDTFYSIRVGSKIVNDGINSLKIDSLSWHKNLKYCNPHWLNDVVIYLSYSIGNFFGVYLITLIETIILRSDIVFYNK